MCVWVYVSLLVVEEGLRMDSFAQVHSQYDKGSSSMQAEHVFRPSKAHRLYR